MVGSAFLLSTGRVGMLDFFSTRSTGVGTGSAFVGTGEATETGVGTTAEEFGCSVVDGPGFAEGSGSEGADFCAGGVAVAGTSWRGRLFNSRVAWNSGRSLLKP